MGITLRLAVVIPTIGRRSLVDALASVVPQLGLEDLVYVMFDGSHEAMLTATADVRREYQHEFNRVWFYAMPYGEGGLGGYGHPQRNRALSLLPNEVEYVWSLDDDDVATQDALAAIRSAAEFASHWDRPQWLACQMRFGPGSHAAGITCWREAKIQLGDIGTPCIVMPRHAKSRWGTLGKDPRGGPEMGAGYFGDWEMARDLEAELGAPVFVNHIVCEVRP